MKIIVIILSIVILHNCDNTPLKSSKDVIDQRLTYYTVSVSTYSATITWTCNVKSKGYLIYGQANPDIFLSYGNQSTIHIMILNNLIQETTYKYYVICGELGNVKGTSLLQTFTTLPIESFIVPEFTIPNQGVVGTGLGSPGAVHLLTNSLVTRGIWILGGISAGNSVSQVDLFDPVSNTWYASVTTIPTPRTNAGIVSNNGKIYVIGGLIGNSAQSLVEEYDPTLNSWRTMANMPVNLQGFIVASVGNDIYAIGGSTTAYMVSGTLPPFNLYRFTPGIGSNGSWVTIVSSTALFSRSDMAGCSIDGLIFMFGGRYYQDGSSFATGDAYIPAANTTTTLGESNLTQSRHGLATACYRPIPTDPFPLDTKALFAIGGSTSSDLNQPVGAISPSNVYNYYQPLTNTMNASPVFPIYIYGAAAEISYINRKLYVFGGSTIINTSTKKVYSTGLEFPTSGPWQLETLEMPISRVGHTAVILSR